mmetsp:Transcript_117804/g.367065  ORF Transcript_117804/g.367065 Transcript_117804/m.367065 type:complete len:373 (+) Transcript_117804:91-1209(+)
MVSMMVTGATVGSVVLLALVLTLMSLKQVDQNEYGLVFNWMTKQIGSKVFHGGLHLIGFWNTFVTFPATVQTIEFSERTEKRTTGSLHTRTKEGLALHLGIAFQYKLNPDGLPDLYALTNLQYESLYVRIARDQLLEVASDYEGPQYWQERKEIGDKMREQVNAQLLGSHASLWDLELLRIDLPDQYEASITKTQVQQQLIKTKQNEQIAAGIRADTEILRAEYQRKIRVVQAGANANYSLVTQLADGRAKQRSIEAEANALNYVRRKLSLSTVGAVEYQQLGAYAGLPNATILANVASATPVISAGSVAGRAPGFLQTGEAVAPATGPGAVEPAASPTATKTGAGGPASRPKRPSLRLTPHSLLQVACRYN